MTRALLSSLFLLPVAFCHHTEVAAPPVSTFCSIARPITWVPEDTRITKEQIDAHNRTWKRLCKKK
jgi:hypothetical protein